MTIHDKQIQNVIIYVVTRMYCKNWTMYEIMTGVEQEDNRNYIMFKQIYPEAVEYVENQLEDITKWMSS